MSGGEPRTSCTLTEHSTTNPHLQPSGVCTAYDPGSGCRCAVSSGKQKQIRGFLSLGFESCKRTQGCAGKPGSGCSRWDWGSELSGLFLRGSVPSAQGSLGGNGAITWLLWFSGKSDLTVDAVKLHNELQSGTLSLGKSQAPETTMDQDPEVAFTEKSSGTFLSGLSDCTNVTFSKVQRFWESNSAAHKEVGDWTREFVGQWAGHIQDFLQLW